MLKIELGIAIALCSPAFVLGGETLATYELEFRRMWSPKSHPIDYPSNAHFSGLIGATHSDALQLWEIGGLATPGVEDVAERGNKALHLAEIDVALDAGTAWSKISRFGLSGANQSRIEVFDVRESFSLVTIMTMIAPSPDWFVGVSSLDLRAGGDWIDKLSIDLFPIDAGTDSGTTFTSPNLNTNPQVPIAYIPGFPFVGTPAIASFTFTLVEVGELPPNGDFDGDGDIDGDDFLAWQAGFGTQTGATAETGDADFDGDVDGDDFLVWQQQFGSAGGSLSAIPEPTSAALFLASVVLFAAKVRAGKSATLVQRGI